MVGEGVLDWHSVVSPTDSALFPLDMYQVTQEEVAQAYLRGQETESVFKHTSLQEDYSGAA